MTQPDASEVINDLVPDAVLAITNITVSIIDSLPWYGKVTLVGILATPFIKRKFRDLLG